MYLMIGAWMAAAAAAPGVAPQWRAQPSPELMQEFYPVAAELVRLPGRAVLNCEVSLEGRAEACMVGAEAPAGLGFGTAALNLAPAFRFKPARIDGKPGRGTLSIPIRFALPEDPREAVGRAYAPRPSSPSQQALARQLSARGGYAARMAEELRQGVETQIHERDEMREDPALRAEAAAAVRGAAEAVIADMGEMVALALAGAFSEPELEALIAAPEDDLKRKLESRRRRIDPDGVAAALSLRMTAAARERFCAARDCGDGVTTGGR